MTTIRMTVSANYGRWKQGFGNIGPEMKTVGVLVWRQATEVMFSRSQEFAHVLSGENKSSGSFDAGVEGDELVGTIEYDSDHAIYEERRGGSHAFLGRAWEATEKTFADALPEAWEAVVRSWK